MRKVLIGFVLLLVFSPVSAYAQTYYVDATGGNDNNPGTSPSSAWRTISKVNSVSFSPGDNVLFKKGETWREKLEIPSSGSSGNLITFSSYGSGADPIILGSEEVIGVAGDWTDTGGNVWKRALATECEIVVFDSTNMGVEDATPDSQYEWDWAGNELFVYSAGNPMGYYTSIEAGQRNDCIHATTKNYIKIENFDLKYCNRGAVYLGTSSSYWTVQNNTMSYIDNFGVYLATSTGCTVDSNTIHHCPDGSGRHGISVVGNATGNTLSNNTISYWWDGIRLLGASSNTVSGNEIHHTHDDGIDIAVAGTEGNIIKYNLIHDATDDGIKVHIDADNNEIYYNVVYDCGHNQYVDGADGNTWYNNIADGTGVPVDSPYPSGFYASGDASNVTLKNFISYNNRYHILKQAGSTLSSMDYNCYYPVDSTHAFNYELAVKATLAQWQATIGGESNSMDSDPLFVDAANRDFHLQPNSPCIDAGIGVGLTQDFEGNPVPQGSTPDIGAYEYESEPPICEPNTYYVDATNGDDNNDGRCTNTAWKTIDKVNSMSFSPGDSILFNKDDTWREQLNPPSAGSSGSQITFGAYGSGDNPLILGSEEFIGEAGDWSDEGGNVWSRAMATQCKLVVFDSTNFGVEDATPDSAYEWDWVANELFVYSVGNPTGVYASIEASQRSYCIVMQDADDYITIDGIDCKFGGTQNILFLTNAIGGIVKNLTSSYSGESGVYFQGANQPIDVDNVTTTYTGTYGIAVLDATSGTVQNCDCSYSSAAADGSWFHILNIHGSSNLLIENNHLHHALSAGEGIGGDRYNNCIIQNNEINNNYQTGIDLSGVGAEKCHDNIVRYNLIYSNKGGGMSGILVYSGNNEEDGAPDNEIYYNILYDEVYAILLSGDVNGNKVYNNVVYDCERNFYLDKRGTTPIRKPSNNIIKNNIFHTASEYLILVDSGLFDEGNVCDYNCHYDSDFTNKFDYGPSYSTLADWQSGTGQDANSINSDPLFINAPANNFHLQSTSSCIDAGTNLGLTQDFEGNPVPQGNAPDIGAYEYASEIPGDLSGDGVVDIVDLSMVASDFGKTSNFDPNIDVIPNSEIDIYDVVFIASRFT